MARTKKVATEATETKAVSTTETSVVEKPAKKVVVKKATKAKATKASKVEKTETVEATPVKSKATLSSFATIIRPVITEKTMKGIEKAQKITVEVDGNANKTAIKLAFEATYKVKVKKVNVVNVRAKYTRRGQHPGTISGFKKAIVTLVSGQALDVFKE
jgi:large subunit ribosomal protein L23